MVLLGRLGEWKYLFNTTNMEEGSHKVILVSRAPEDSNLGRNLPVTGIVVNWLNDFVRKPLRDGIILTTNKRFRELYSMVERNPQTIGVAGFMYGFSLLARWLRVPEISLELRDHDSRDPLMQSVNISPSYRFSFWPSDTTTPLKIRLDGVTENEDMPERFVDLECNVLYFLRKPNVPTAIDFIIRDGVTETCYGLLATVSDQHDVDDRRYDIIKGLGLLEQSVKCKYVHVLVKNSMLGLSVPCPLEEDDKAAVWPGEFPFPIYAAHVPLRSDE